ncbi:MAG TPA: bifunctional shikimate kinase/3-dehydroquinate synthase, partial [Kofleriaceae bacterium]|nr:bifunctional shikimate kinase/3-dehydroquinate synthase [Kofleriaceae bacterium]
MAALFLIGFMAAGKTSVGRAIAAQTGRRFVDLDDVIAAAGEPVASLVARDEPEFRRRESQALADVIAAAGDGPVIATGGGAAAHADNLARMRAAGIVVALGVDVADAEIRARGGPNRPLLASARELAARRAPVYRRAHAMVDTTGRTIAAVTAEVVAVEASWTALPARHRDATTILGLGDRSYPIIVHDEAIDGALVRAYAGSRIAVITDREVSRYWRAAAEAALGAVDVVEIDAGEASKSFAVYQRVCEELVARGLDRASVIVALGGGVVGDLAGFVAATLYRGIPILQLPTTIVAMTDAAIGGKTAIDVSAGKNLVGAFHQPRLVACGLATLATLPARERRAGFGELWKYALLDGRELWQAVDACTAWARDGGEPTSELRTVIHRSIAYKAAIVSRDEREQTGHRALLNLGHTVGHAIESASGMHHGEAVGLGLVAACRVSAALGHPDLTGEVT